MTQMHQSQLRTFSDTMPSKLGDVTSPNPGFDKARFVNPSVMTPQSSEMFVNTAMQKVTVETKTTQKKMSRLAVSGWGASGMATVETLPKFHPKRNKFEKNAMPIEKLTEAASSIQRCIRASSFQAAYTEDPLCAKVQTSDSCEFFIDFWQSESGTEFYIDMQQRRGEKIFATMHMRKIMKAAKEGFDEEEANINSAPFIRERLLRLQSVLNQAGPTNATVGNSDSDCLALIHQNVMSSSLESRKMGMQLLLTTTNLSRTLGSGACPAAIVVLAGKSPNTAGFDDQKAAEIQNVLLSLLRNKEFQGDAERFIASEADMSVNDVEPFFATVEGSRNRPRYYEEFTDELLHMALTILVQSLEVAECFPDHFSQHVQEFQQKHVTEGSLDLMLKACIADVKGPLASQSLSSGYLACKALRVLAQSNNYISQIREGDATVREDIRAAIDAGKFSHALLQQESERLYQVVYGHL